MLLMNKLLMNESFMALVLLMNESFMEQHEHVPEAVPLVLIMNESFTVQDHVPEVVPLVVNDSSSTSTSRRRCS